jgi:hypothetical protein
LPPFPLGVYTKLQAVPRCSPFCDTRAPPPSLPKGDRLWELRVAHAAEKQWAQIRDLAQIQIGGSYEPWTPWTYRGPYGELVAEEVNALGMVDESWGYEGGPWVKAKAMGGESDVGNSNGGANGGVTNRNAALGDGELRRKWRRKKRKRSALK